MHSIKNKVAISFMTIASIYGFSGVIMGAITGHDGRVMEVYLQIAQQYFFFHTFALFMVALLLCQYEDNSPKELIYAGVFFIIGSPTFSASLFYKVTHGVAIPMLNPFGGTMMILGWVALIIYGVKRLLR